MATPTTEKPGLAVLLKRAAGAFADWFWTNMVVGAFGVWLLGEVFRDSNRATALCFLVPSLFSAVILLVTALLAWLCTCRRIALAAAILCLGPTLSLLLVENRWRRPRAEDDTAARLRLVHWNVGGAQGDRDSVLKRLKPHEADIHVLSEIYDTAATRSIAKALGDGYQVFQVRQLAVIARGPAKLIKRDERIRSRGYFVRWESKAGPLTLLLVDLPSRPIYYHAGWLQQVRERIAEHRPDIIVGDFNSSRRSRALTRLPEGYAHAYSQAGAGWSYTWPDRFPLWDIDQCITGPRIRPIRYDLVTTRVSDHRMQVLDFAVK